MKPVIRTFEGKKKNGKNVLLIGGVHGNELTPVYALGLFLIQKVHQGPVLDNIKSLTIINGLNTTGIKNLERDIVRENTNDLNRMLSNEESNEPLSLLKEHIAENDAVIDIHSSPSCNEFALIDIDEYTMSIKRWCDLAGVTTAFRYSGANTIKRYCLENGKLALTLEINKLEAIDHTSALKCIDLLEGLIRTVDDVELEESVPELTTPIQEIKTYKEGLFFPSVPDRVRMVKNEVIGTLKDIELNTIKNIRSDMNAKVITLSDETYVNRGDTLYIVQPIGDEPITGFSE